MTETGLPDVRCGTFTLTDTEKRALVAAAEDARAARAASMPTDLDAVRVVCDGVHRLHELGWRDPIYAPRNTPLQLIEAGSSGIHTGYRDDIGFWIQDDDTWPSNPILWRASLPSPTRGGPVSEKGTT